MAEVCQTTNYGVIAGMRYPMYWSYSTIFDFYLTFGSVSRFNNAMAFPIPMEVSELKQSSM
jgi:hypothetical protein